MATRYDLACGVWEAFFGICEHAYSVGLEHHDPTLEWRTMEAGISGDVDH